MGNGDGLTLKTRRPLCWGMGRDSETTVLGNGEGLGDHCVGLPPPLVWVLSVKGAPLPLAGP